MKTLQQKDLTAVSGGVKAGPSAPSGICVRVDPSLDPICPGPEPEQLM